MQTFLPYPDFAKSARCLDRQRLGKQRVEALQIMDALTIPDSGWANHPATLMWTDHVPALIRYTEAMCDEWVRRGYDNTKCGEKVARYKQVYAAGIPVNPWWMGDRQFHLQHKRKLMWKDPYHYQDHFKIYVPTEEPHYLWPQADGTFRRG